MTARTLKARAQHRRIALREAAIEWYLLSRERASDDRDSHFKRIDQRLFKAAIAYAECVGYRRTRA